MTKNVESSVKNTLLHICIVYIRENIDFTFLVQKFAIFFYYIY